MAKHSAVIVVALAFLLVPALASADPTSTHITSPATTTYVDREVGQLSTLHVAGTTSGGTGNVDLRCYYGTKGPLIASQVPVVNGAFSVDVSLAAAQLWMNIGPLPPYCMLRAVPTGTVPAAAPDVQSPWQGVYIGWGVHESYTVGSGFSPTPADTVRDYHLTRSQPKAYNDYWSVGRCGLCDTYLVVPGSLAMSNGIWWGNAVLYANPYGITTRTAVQIDGASAWTGTSAYDQGPASILVNKAGFPAVSETHTVDASGDLTLEERSPYIRCAEGPGVFPPNSTSCASLADTGVRFERSIRQTDSGQRVTIVDHWKSVDGKPHQLDAIYEDTEHSANAASADRGGRANFLWVNEGLRGYATPTQIPLPSVVPASMLVQTDGSTPPGGDNSNPYGAMTYGSKPSAVTVVGLGDGKTTGYWHTRYQRTIPAGGEITIAVAYTHDFALASVQSKRQAAEVAVAAPTVKIDAPADGSSLDAAAAHVTGTVSSPDGAATVKVNGVAATIGSDGHWSADVALGDGANQILAQASNKIGAVENAIISVTRVPAAAAPATDAPAPATSQAPASTAAPTAAPAGSAVRCVVPKLRGKSLTKAKRLLARAHCRLGKVVRKPTTKVKPGRVVATRFKAGTRLRAGTRIRVTLAKHAS